MKSKKKLRLAVILSAVFVFLCLCVIWVLNTMIGFTAGSKLAELNGRAQEIYRCAEEYIRADIVGTQSFTGYDGDRMYYAVIVEDGRLAYTLASSDYIDKSELAPPDRERQLALLSNIFARNGAIGYYDGNDGYFIG